MTTFQASQRVTVTEQTSPLFGRSGTVWHCLMRDKSAWVTMDEQIPDAVRTWPVGDERANHVLLWPDEVKAAL